MIRDDERTGLRYISPAELSYSLLQETIDTLKAYRDDAHAKLAARGMPREAISYGFEDMSLWDILLTELEDLRHEVAFCDHKLFVAWLTEPSDEWIARQDAIAEADSLLVATGRMTMDDALAEHGVGEGAA